MTTISEEPCGRCSECGAEITPVEAHRYNGLCRVCFYKQRHERGFRE